MSDQMMFHLSRALKRIEAGVKSTGLVPYTCAINAATHGWCRQGSAFVQRR